MIYRSPEISILGFRHWTEIYLGGKLKFWVSNCPPTLLPPWLSLWFIGDFCAKRLGWHAFSCHCSAYWSTVYFLRNTTVMAGGLEKEKKKLDLFPKITSWRPMKSKNNENKTKISLTDFLRSPMLLYLLWNQFKRLEVFCTVVPTKILLLKLSTLAQQLYYCRSWILSKNCCQNVYTNIWYMFKTTRIDFTVITVHA